MEIIPSILEKDKAEVLKKIEAVRALDLTVQIDLCDGSFVPNQTVKPQDLPAELRSMSWEGHLMVNDPVTWSHPLYMLACKRVYWHVEVLSDPNVIPRQYTKIEHGLALRLETPVSVVDKYVPLVKSVLLLSIDEPGYQGEKFQDSVFDKIQELRHKHPGIHITIDGGINLEHMMKLKKLGVERVSVGSPFWKYGDPRTVLSAFRQATL
jgi:ribulose-phosphate 3-epimerase